MLLSSPSVESKIHWLRSRLFKSRYLRGEYITYTLLYFYIFLLYRIKLTLFTLNCIVYGCFSRLSVKTSSLARVFFIGSRSSQNKRDRIVCPILLSVKKTFQNPFHWALKAYVSQEILNWHSLRHSHSAEL